MYSQARVSSNRMVETAALTLSESTKEDGKSSRLLLLMVSTRSDSRARCGDTPLPSDPINTSLFFSSVSSLRNP